MSTLAFFHAHPDDEAIATGGTMARAAAEGHRVVVVTATGGELGERPEGIDSPEALRILRADETHEACRHLGVAWGHFLGYRDSGMAGDEANEHPECFWKADVEDAATKLAAVLTEQKVDVLAVYDDHGGYGHPDHIQVHRVGVRAAELAGIERVYEATADRDYMKAIFASVVEEGTEGLDRDAEQFDFDEMWVPAEMITTRVDVTRYLDQKRAAMAAHRSQIAETSFFLNLTPERFREVWGQECFVRRGAPPGTSETWLLDHS
jgi:LmbE family N-acetylglucosaminyl deacetylase